ncbi:patatin-like phospholipase family protein [Bradyrhizobium sp.]|uniref:patatin-like phospholipase family protein n=1 Tax=Bradyrhizobium sp. TaxID=376 RepID=UPI003C7C5612
MLIDLALQGGGSHGAFTWGVLDRLLEEPWLEIAGISGTSAGAMNAAVLANGWAAGAREALHKYWRAVSRAHPQPPQRDLVQLAACQGAADDRAAASGRRSRHRRGRTLGAHEDPPDQERHAGDLRCLVQAQRRMGVRHQAARRGAARGARTPRNARDRSRRAFDGRSRHPAGGVLRRWGSLAFRPGWACWSGSRFAAGACCCSRRFAR